MRKGGVLLSISSLPGGGGIGSLGKEAYAFVDFLKRSGLKCWQVLPLCQTSYGDSPYQSPSAMAGNPYFVDLDLLVEEGLLPGYPRVAPAKVNYERIYIDRYPLLREAYGNFIKLPHEDYERFKEAESDWLDDYALFMSIKSANDMKCFSEWSQPLKNRQAEAVEQYREGGEFWKFVQYEFFKQWKALKAYANENGVEIMGDMPIYVAYDSVEIWAHREMFLLDENMNPTSVAGVPPDAFSESGQLWGNPLYDWDYMEKDSFSWWVKRIRMAMRMFDSVRIDHFRGFAAYYSIPFGRSDAKIGEWKKGAGQKLFAEINRQCENAAIIAEDLGYLDEDVRELLKATGYPGMKILQFAFGSGEDNEYLPKFYGENCVAYTGTHDNATTRQWLSEQTAEVREQVKEVTEKYGRNTVWNMIDALLDTKARYVILPMQDFLCLGVEARMNVPSTTGGNWEWRLDALPQKSLENKIREHLRRYDRL